MTITQTLLLLLKQQKISESELAKRTGVSQAVINRMTTAALANPRLKTMRRLADYFQISLSQLVGDEPLPPGLYPKVGIYKIPVLGWSSYAITQWIQHKDSRGSYYSIIDFETNEMTYALKLKGSSMEPRFPEGTLLIIDPTLKPQDRDFAVVHKKGSEDISFRQVLIDAEDFYLKPLNADFKIQAGSPDYEFLGTVIQAKMGFTRTTAQAQTTASTTTS